MVGVTLDTNVLLSATLWNGSVSQQLLFYLIKTDVTMYSSKEIIEEYERILKRDFKFSEEEIQKLVEKVLLFVTIVAPKTKIEFVKNDPDDDKIIECAVESQSKFIITYDKDLLTLKEYQGLKIIKPEEARLIL